MRGRATWPAAITDSDRVIMWNVFLERYWSGTGSGDVDGLAVYRVNEAWIANVEDSHQPDDYFVNSYGPEPAFDIGSAETIFVNQCGFHQVPQALGSGEGGAGIAVGLATQAYIAETESVGGEGGPGWWGFDCWWNYVGGPGGPGIRLVEDQNPDGGSPAGIANVYGRPENVIQGGPGGEGKTETEVGLPCGDRAPGGDGGEGVLVEGVGRRAGVCRLFGVEPHGGPGGIGNPPGDPGEDLAGNVQIFPSEATSTMQGTGKLGTDVTFSFHGLPGDRLVVLYSTELDILENPRWHGQPLQTSPTGRFGTFPGGTIPGTGTISFTVTIPASVPPGEPFYVQGVVLRTEEPPILTNISMVVTTPVWP
jgi:hypothetical protein